MDFVRLSVLHDSLVHMGLEGETMFRFVLTDSDRVRYLWEETLGRSVDAISVCYRSWDNRIAVPYYDLQIPCHSVHKTWLLGPSKHFRYVNIQRYNGLPFSECTACPAMNGGCNGKLACLCGLDRTYVGK